MRERDITLQSLQTAVHGMARRFRTGQVWEATRELVRPTDEYTYRRLVGRMLSKHSGELGIRLLSTAPVSGQGREWERTS